MVGVSTRTAVIGVSLGASEVLGVDVVGRVEVRMRCVCTLDSSLCLMGLVDNVTPSSCAEMVSCPVLCCIGGEVVSVDCLVFFLLSGT